jgi:hypothetical protein
MYKLNVKFQCKTLIQGSEKRYGAKVFYKDLVQEFSVEDHNQI